MTNYFAYHQPPYIFGSLMTEYPSDTYIHLTDISFSFLSDIALLASNYSDLSSQQQEHYYDLIFNFLLNLPYPNPLPSSDFGLSFGISRSNCNHVDYFVCRQKNFLRRYGSYSEPEKIGCGLTNFSLKKSFCEDTFTCYFAIDLPKTFTIKDPNRPNYSASTGTIYFVFEGVNNKTYGKSFTATPDYLLSFNNYDFSIWYNEFLKYDISGLNFLVTYSQSRSTGVDITCSSVPSVDLEYGFVVYYPELEYSDIVSGHVNEIIEYKLLGSNFVCKPIISLSVGIGFCDIYYPDWSSCYFQCSDENDNILFTQYASQNSGGVIYNDELDTSSNTVYFKLVCDYVTGSTIINPSINCGRVRDVDLCDYDCEYNSELINDNFHLLRSRLNSVLALLVRIIKESDNVDYTNVLTQIAQNLSIMSNDVNTNLDNINTNITNINDKLQTTEIIDNSQKSITDVLNQQANTIQVDEIGLLRSKKGYY